jgi:asparagine synthase (glutamine-hydrolysing)
MPGIVGLISRMPREQAQRELRQMVEALRHENFYVTGMHVGESVGVYVGWAARKDPFADRMPLRNERGDVILIFSGEEFPAPETVQGLRARGHQFELDGPGYLAHLYEEDSSFPAGLNGRFHGLLMDRRRGTTVLFNDRYGMHRIYFYETRDAFYFAAEAKAILAVRPELRTIDRQALGELIVCGCVLENRTLFHGLQVLPPASKWVFRNSSIERKGHYFHPREWEEQEKFEPEAYYRELCHNFTRNLPRYFNGRQPIAMSLTGGLDTRMIMAWQKPAPGSLPCYTFGSMLRENQDVRVARRVAGLCNQPHQIVSAGPEFLSQFPRYAERSVYLTDGCVDVGRAPDLYLNERAREIAPVRMTGNYGGEVLRMVRAFKPQGLLAGLFAPELNGDIARAKQTYSDFDQCHPVSFAAFRQGPWHHHGVLALEQTQLALRSPYLDNDVVRTAFRAPASALATDEISLRIIADGNRDLLRIPTDRGVVGNRGRFLGVGYRGFLEFLFKAEYAYDMGMPQWLARLDHVFATLRLERLFLGRHKIFHFRIWYRDVLAGYVQDMLLDPRGLSRPYVERKVVEEVVRRHVKGDRNYTTQIHKLLTLELVHRLFIDAGCPSSSGTRDRVPITVSRDH